MLIHDNLLLAIAVALAVAGAIWDVRAGIIPNRLVAWGLITAVAARPLTAVLGGGVPAALESLLDGLLGVLVCASVPALMYALRAIGGGDVKLLAVVGFCLGPRPGFELTFHAFSIGSVYALLRLAYAGTLLQALNASATQIVQPLLPRRARRALPGAAVASVPFAPAIAAAALVSLLLRWRIQ